MRRAGYATSNGVFYLLSDQLHSTSVIANQAGVEAARQYYSPFGGNRGGAAFSSLTTRRFTGQYHEASLPGAEGLSYYNARWYDPQLGRFTSPDTIVPKPESPQAFNRYSYALNNPLGLYDPSGHSPCKAGSKCISQPSGGPSIGPLTQLLALAHKLFLSAPNLFIRGFAVNTSLLQGSIETVYDFSRNEVGYFYAYGTGVGTDEFSAGVSVYTGVGWRRYVYEDSKFVPVTDAYRGRAIGFTATLNDLPVVAPSANVTISISARTQTHFDERGYRTDITFPRFKDGIVTATAGTGKSVDLATTGADGRVFQVDYESIAIRHFDNDAEFALTVFLDPVPSPGEKTWIITQIFAIDTVNGSDGRR